MFCGLLGGRCNFLFFFSNFFGKIDFFPENSFGLLDIFFGKLVFFGGGGIGLNLLILYK